MNEDDLMSAAGVSPLELCGQRLLRVDALRHLLPVVGEYRWVILGIEGFQVIEDSIRPRMDQIADFSALMDLPSQERSGASVHEAMAFLTRHADSSLLFELALVPAD